MDFYWMKMIVLMLVFSPIFIGKVYITFHHFATCYKTLYSNVQYLLWCDPPLSITMLMVGQDSTSSRIPHFLNHQLSCCWYWYAGSTVSTASLHIISIHTGIAKIFAIHKTTMMSLW